MHMCLKSTSISQIPREMCVALVALSFWKITRLSVDRGPNQGFGQVSAELCEDSQGYGQFIKRALPLNRFSLELLEKLGCMPDGHS